MNLDDWSDDRIERIREAVRGGAQQLWRWRRHVQLPCQTEGLSLVDLEKLIDNSGTASMPQTGESSVAAAERTHEAPKTCKINNRFSEEVSERKDVVE